MNILIVLSSKNLKINKENMASEWFVNVVNDFKKDVKNLYGVVAVDVNISNFF